VLDTSTEQPPEYPICSPVLEPVAGDSAGPDLNIPLPLEPRAHREVPATQLPLQEGRKVAFHLPSDSGTDEGDWVLVLVVKCIDQGENRSVVPSRHCQSSSGSRRYSSYVVQDAEPPGGRHTRSVSTEAAQSQHVNLTYATGSMIRHSDQLYHSPILAHLPIPRHTRAHILFSLRAQRSWRCIRKLPSSIQQKF